MTRSVYYTATTLDGFIADEHDSLAWLFEQDTEEGGPAGYEEFIAGIGAMVMGATTYAWVGDHMRTHDEPWMYDIPCWVFTHRTLEPLDEASASSRAPSPSTATRSPPRPATATCGSSAAATSRVSSPTPASWTGSCCRSRRSRWAPVARCSRAATT